MSKYDAVIIGAGHNGLICAAYLAKSGRRILLLEASEQAGGLAAAREFYPGYKTTIAHTINHLPKSITDALVLEKHGLEIRTGPLKTIGLDQEGKHVYVMPESIEGVDDRDISAFTEYNRLLGRFSDALRPFWLKTIPDMGVDNFQQLLSFGHIGWNVRRLGKADMGEFFRIITLPARDLMDDFFENELLKATLSWDGLIGSRLAPRSPNGAVISMLYRMAGNFNNEKNSHVIPAGGISGLIDALTKSAQGADVEIRTGTPVGKILINEDTSGIKATGVKLTDGEVIHAETIISNADPRRTFFDLLGVEYLEIEFSNRIKRLRARGYVAKLHLALDSLPEFTGLNDPQDRLIIAPTMDDIEFAFDDAKYGHYSTKPVMEIVLPTLHDPDLAPDGKHILSAHVMYAPYQTDENEASKDEFKHRIIDVIAKYAPGIRDKILYSELLTPADLERDYRVTGGHWHHIEVALDQLLMMRPTYEAGQYQTPVAGLYLCGAGSHPGGGITGGPGHNAAHAIMANQ